MTRSQRDAAPNGRGGKRRDKQAANGAAGNGAVSAGEVERYLREHPEFLRDHPELLAVLDPPERINGDGIVDFQQAMVERLRGELAEALLARDDLVLTGRSNMAAQGRIHESVLALMRARSFEQLIEVVTVDLAVILDLDVVTLGVEVTDEELPPVRVGGLFQLKPDTVDAVIGRNRDMLLRPEIGGDPTIFGAGAGLVASDALIRLRISRQTPMAMLALGSRQAEHFHPGQGTELLGFLGHAVETSIRGWLSLAT